MGRLFWKLFLAIWLAQVATALGVAVTMTLEHQAREAAHGPPPPPPDGGSRDLPHFPPGDGAHPPPPPEFAPHPRHGPPPVVPPVPLAIGLFTSLVFAGLLAHYLVKPVRLLRSAFDAASKGDLNRPVGPLMGARRDELADLARDFDQVAERLRNLLEGQQRLFHDVSHELRSPLTRLQAAVDLARQQPEHLEDWLRRMELESGRMDRLVGQILTLSRLNAGMTPCAQERLDMVELLQGIVEDTDFEAASQGKHVELATPQRCEIRGHGELLRSAIENVVRNAVHHTATGSTVHIGLRSDENRAFLEVLDRGPGVPEQELTRIFETFQRGSNARTGEGFGLGLSITQRVVSAHGGSVVASNRPDGGLAVRIELPFQRG